MDEPVFDIDSDLLPLVKAAYYGDPDEQTTLLVLADALQERNDPREHWVRAGVTIWADAIKLSFGASGERPEYAEFEKWVTACNVHGNAGRRVVTLWTTAVFRFAAGSGYRRSTVLRYGLLLTQRVLRFWALGLISSDQLCRVHQNYCRVLPKPTSAGLWAIECQMWMARRGNTVASFLNNLCADAENPDGFWNRALWVLNDVAVDPLSRYRFPPIPSDCADAVHLFSDGPHQLAQNTFNP